MTPHLQIHLDVSIDSYWDHVGGTMLDDVLLAAAPKARFVVSASDSIAHTKD